MKSVLRVRLIELVFVLVSTVMMGTAFAAEAVPKDPADTDATPAVATQKTVTPPDTKSVAPASSAATTPQKGSAAGQTGAPNAGWLSKLWAWVNGNSGFAIVVAIVVLATALMLMRSVKGLPKPVRIVTLTTPFFFWLSTGYLLLLMVIGAFYEHVTKEAVLLGGLLPVAVPWFGAVGAVTISLAGVFEFSDKRWNPDFNYWHIGRPLFGAVLGVVAFFMFVLILTTAGTEVPIFKAPPRPPQEFIIYYVLAFLVGYREATFRDLVKRVTDLILKPGTEAARAPTIVIKANNAVITTLDFATVTSGQTRDLEIDVENTGDVSLQAPNATITDTTGRFTIVSNPLSGTKELKPGAAAKLRLQFAPNGQGALAGQLTVSGSNLEKAVTLPLAGVGGP